VTPRRPAAVRAPARSLSPRWVGPLALSVLGLYGALALETLTRARRLCHRADAAWAEALDPALRRAAREDSFTREADRWAARRDRDPRSREILRLETDLLQARHEIRTADFPAKRAFYGYRAVYRHAAPPESPWSRRARLRAPAARELWRRDLAQRRLPVEPWMLDPDPGDTEERRVVFSTRGRRTADGAVALLKAAGFDVSVVDGPARYGDRPGDRWITVPATSFWPAHERLRAWIDPDDASALLQST
jgi:hypothetical protein